MTITTLDHYLTAIDSAHTISRLQHIRQVLRSRLNKLEITISVYTSLNKEIRSRSEWIKNRGDGRKWKYQIWQIQEAME